MPAAPAPVDGSRPEAGCALWRQRAVHEAPSAGSGGAGGVQPALVLLGPAAQRPHEAARAQHLQGLRGAGDH